jgi:hypothetical protein
MKITTDFDGLTCSEPLNNNNNNNNIIKINAVCLISRHTLHYSSKMDSSIVLVMQGHIQYLAIEGDKTAVKSVFGDVFI